MIFMAYPAVLGLYFSRYKLSGFILEKQQQHPSRIMRVFPICNSDYWVFLMDFPCGIMRNKATAGFQPRFSPRRSKLEP